MAQQKDARATQNLGNGFRRTVFRSRTIRPFEILTIPLPAASGRVVITAGWSITEVDDPAWAINSYPTATTRWVLTIQNPTGLTRTITPYLITKRR